MVNVLVTGGLGHIGSALIRELAGVGGVTLVRILDNFLTQRYASLFNLPTNIEYDFIEGDIRNGRDLDRALQEIDVVFHLAAITDAPSTIPMPELTEEVNAIGTRKVVQACVQHKVAKIVYPSTTSVYGASEGVVTEETPCNPQTPYARCKLLGEREVLHAAKDGKIEGFVLRLGTIAGPSIGMRFHTAVNRFVFQACMGVPLTVWEKAYDQKRPYLTLSDGLAALIFMMNVNRGTGEIYNVLTQNATVREIVNYIRSYVPDLEVTTTESPILNQTSYFVSDAKIRRLGAAPSGDLKQAVAGTVRMFRAFISTDIPV